MTELELPDAVADHPPSDKFVLFAIKTTDGWLSRQDLRRATMLDGGTLYKALSRLLDDGIIERTTDPEDMRRYLYNVPDS